MLDVGANVDCSAQHLEQFALMGNEFAGMSMPSQPSRGTLEHWRGRQPRGTRSRRKRSKLLKASPLNFIGNIEGGTSAEARMWWCATDLSEMWL